MGTDCLQHLTTGRVQIHAEISEKVAIDLVLGSGFRRFLRFPPPLTTDQSRITLNMAEKWRLSIVKFYIVLQLFRQSSFFCKKNESERKWIA